MSDPTRYNGASSRPKWSMVSGSPRPQDSGRNFSSAKRALMSSASEVKLLIALVRFRYRAFRPSYVNWMSAKSAIEARAVT